MFDDNPFFLENQGDSSASWKDALLYTLGALTMLALGLIGDYLKHQM